MVSELLTDKELAARLKVSAFTVRVWAREKIIPSVMPSPRVRRFFYEDVIGALKKLQKRTAEMKK